MANSQENRYVGPEGNACDWYDRITRHFDARAGKVPVARGFGEDGKVVEVLANQEGDFTIVIVSLGSSQGVDGKWTCAIKHGVGWDELKAYMKEDMAL